MSGRLSITETGASFTLQITALDSSDLTGIISLDLELLVLPTEEMVGTPAMIRNRVTIPYTRIPLVKNGNEEDINIGSSQDLPPLEITCKFN